MIANVLLLSSDEIKSESVIEKNTDPAILSKVVRDVQIISLRPILGDSLYQEVLGYAKAYAEANTVIPTVHRTLIYEYIKPFLLHSVLRDWITINSYKFSNKGVQKLRDDSSDTVNSQDLGFLNDYYSNRIESFRTLLENYLREHKLIEGCEVPGAAVGSASSGWFLMK